MSKCDNSRITDKELAEQRRQIAADFVAMGSSPAAARDTASMYMDARDVDGEPPPEDDEDDAGR